MFTVLNDKRVVEFESKTAKESIAWIRKNAPIDKGGVYYLQENDETILTSEIEIDMWPRDGYEAVLSDLEVSAKYPDLERVRDRLKQIRAVYNEASCETRDDMGTAMEAMDTIARDLLKELS